MGQSYPSFRYHKTHAPEGLLVQTSADEPQGPGWVDTPAAFDPRYKKPEPVEEAEEVSIEAKRAGYVRQPYPSHRYRKDGAVVLVNTEEEDKALDQKVWKTTPDPLAWSNPDALKIAQEEQPGVMGLDAAQADSFYGSTIKSILAKLAATPPALPMLAALRLTEQQNPKGARSGVVKALNAAIHAAPLTTFVVALEQIEHPAEVAALQEAEEANPSTARASVLKAIKARKASLSVAA